MSSPDRHDRIASPASPPGRPRPPVTPPTGTTPMLLESTNPEMFMDSGSARHGRSRRLAGGVALLLAAALVAVGVWWFSGRDAQREASPPATAESSASAGPTVANPATETPGAMIPYRDGVADGMGSPSQTIQSFTRAFYELRSTPDVMQYFAPGVPYTEQFVADNIKDTVPGTKFNLYMYPADADKLTNKKPLGESPQMWLVTLILTLPDSKTYVASQQYMTVKVDGQYRIQEWGTLSS